MLTVLFAIYSLQFVLFIFTDSGTISLKERLNTCLDTSNYISVYLINLYCVNQFFIENLDFKDYNILILLIILIIYINCYHISSHIFICHKHGEKHELPEDGQELRPKHFGAIIINKNIVQQGGFKYCVSSL
jgi:hypothetical protein